MGALEVEGIGSFPEGSEGSCAGPPGAGIFACFSSDAVPLSDLRFLALHRLDITLHPIWNSKKQKLLNRPKVKDRAVAYNLHSCFLRPTVTLLPYYN